MPAQVAHGSHFMPTPAHHAHFCLNGAIASFVAPVSASLRVTFTRTSELSAPFARVRRSYSERLTASLRTSYAVTMAWNLFSASGRSASSRILSGWHVSTSLR